jgi:hypothetical protein
MGANNKGNSGSSMLPILTIILILCKDSSNLTGFQNITVVEE